jgi:serine/threonine protein kinase
MANLIGQSLGRYHILEQLGEGGMATVYKAYDTRLESNVAVKVIRTERLAPEILERALKRFEREAKAVARLAHPNIVRVVDYGEQENQPYLVMQYLPGGTLKQRLGKPMPWIEAAWILAPIARALDFAHRQNIIHRDVKPSNILITADGDPMLTDFGIAKIIDEEATVDLTGTSATVGTPEYMAPEQVIAKSVDHRADIYALGIVFYEMVTGRKPFLADTPMAVLFKHVSEPLPRPKQFVPNLPDEVEKILLKALAKKPDDRYQSMAEFANALDKLQHTPVFPVNPEPAKPVVIAAPVESEPTTDQSTRLQEGTVERVDTRLEPAIDQSTILQEGTVEQVDAQPEPRKLSNELVVSLGGGVQMIFMRVPAGKFLMGSPEGEGDKDEHPQHEVYLDEYWMGKTPVTNLQYKTFVKEAGHKPPAYWKNASIPDGKEEHPVVGITWQDAQAFCAWASKVSECKIHLPTEAEWEKAARGTDGRKYPWGNEKPNKHLCNYDYGKLFSGRGATPVGYYSPQGDSPYSCVDMAGNVWEWAADWYSKTYYSSSSSSNPQGPLFGRRRVLRGGSWGYSGYYVRSAYRYWDAPDYKYNPIGFRCARSE